MGLDQWAYSKRPVKQAEFPFMKKSFEDEQIEITCWRKHNRLQGWMERLWESKERPGFDPETMGGSLGDFNCVDVQIDIEDLNRLERDIKDKNLPETGGFFFGDDSYGYGGDDETYEKYYLPDDMAFIKSAKEALYEGKEVVYTCWW